MPSNQVFKESHSPEVYWLQEKSINENDGFEDTDGFRGNSSKLIFSPTISFHNIVEPNFCLESKCIQ